MSTKGGLYPPQLLQGQWTPENLNNIKFREIYDPNVASTRLQRKVQYDLLE